VFRLEPAQKRILDGYEGLGRGYRIGHLPLWTGDHRVDAFAYLAEPDHIDSTIAPFDWYRALVLQGAREAGLPATYCAGIAAAPAMADPDPDRAARAWRLLHLLASDDTDMAGGT
jgi:gamma-glutamylcyclotransferase